MSEINQYDIKYSIILCCYNSNKFLQETLNSIINQTYKNYELIIVDDGSIDNTSIIIKNFISKYKNKKIKYYYKNNSGLGNSRNLAIKKAKYDWIAIIDHDDIWLSNKLEYQSSEIQKNINKKLFFTDFSIWNENKKISRFKIFKEKDKFITETLNLDKYKGFINLILCGCFIGSSTVVFNKNVIKEIGYFNERYKFLTDYIFFLKLSKKYGMHCSNVILSLWRNHDDQSTKKMINNYYLEMFRLYNNLIIFEKVTLKIKLKILKKYLRLILSFFYNKIIK